MAILEMNVAPEPIWSKEFQKYLETEHNFSKLDAMCIIGTLHHYMRKYKEEINEEELDKLANECYPDKYEIGDYDIICHKIYKGHERDCFKAGYRKAKEK